MRSMMKKFLLLCVAAVLASSGTAGAGELAISIQETGYSLQTFTTSSFSNISISGTYSSSAPDFTFNGFTASSSQASAEGSLGGVGSIVVNVPSAVLTIQITETGFTLPPGPNYSMASSSSYTFNGFGTADTLSFQSFATPGQVPFGTGVPSPGHLYDPVLAFGSDSYNEANTPFSAGSGYTLTETFVWTVNSTGTFPDFDNLQPTGQTTVSGASVPEPSSLVLAGLGLLPMVVIGGRRLAKRLPAFRRSS
jgi:PEP-CTERM motif